MARPPIPPGGRPIRVVADDSVQRALDGLHRRTSELESRSDLSGSVASAIASLSGTMVVLSGSINSAVKTLTSGGLTSVTHDASLSGQGTAASPLSAGPTYTSLAAGMSGTVATAYSELQVGVTASVGSAYTSLQAGVTASESSLYSSLQTGVTASVGGAYSVLQTAVTASNTSVTNLSGTVDARFLNLTGSLISGLAETYSSLQAGVTSSVGSAYSVLQTAITGTNTSVTNLSGTVNSRFLNITGSLISGLAETYSSLQAGTTASVGSAYAVLQTAITGTNSSVTNLSGTIDGAFKDQNFSNLGITGSVTITGDLRVSGSITGSGDVLLGSLTVLGRNTNAPLSASAGLDLQLGRQASMLRAAGSTISDVAFGRADGGYRHWIATEHVAGPSDRSNSLKFWLNNSTGTSGSAGPGTGSIFLFGLYGDSSAQLSSSIAVSGNLWALNDVRVSGSLTGSGNFTFAGGGIVSKDVNVGGSITGSGDGTYLRDVYIAGNIFCSGTINTGSMRSLSGTVDAQRVWDGLDPYRGSRYFEDFHLSYSAGPSITLNGGTILYPPSEPGHPGIMKLNMILSGAIAGIYMLGGATKGFGGGPIRYTADIRFLSGVDRFGDGTVTMGARFGWQDHAGTPSTNGVYFEVDQVRNGNTNWKFITVATGSMNVMDMGSATAPVSGSWYRLQILVSPNGDAVTGSVTTGTLSVSVSTKTYVPTSTATDWQPEIWAYKTLNSITGLSCDVDFVELGYIFSNPRST